MRLIGTSDSTLCRIMSLFSILIKMLYDVYDVTDASSLAAVADSDVIDPASLPIAQRLIEKYKLSEKELSDRVRKYTDPARLTHTDAMLLLIATEGHYKEVARIASPILLGVLLSLSHDEAVRGSKMPTFNKLMTVSIQELSSNYSLYSEYLTNSSVIMFLQRREKLHAPLKRTFEEIEFQVSLNRGCTSQQVFDKLLTEDRPMCAYSIYMKGDVDVSATKLKLCKSYNAFKYVLDMIWFNETGQIAPGDVRFDIRTGFHSKVPQRRIDPSTYQEIITGALQYNDQRRLSYVLSLIPDVLQLLRGDSIEDRSRAKRILELAITNCPSVLQLLLNAVVYTDPRLVVAAGRTDDIGLFEMVMRASSADERTIAEAVSYITDYGYVTRLLSTLRNENIDAAIMGMRSVQVGLHPELTERIRSVGTGSNAELSERIRSVNAPELTERIRSVGTGSHAELSERIWSANAQELSESSYDEYFVRLHDYVRIRNHPSQRLYGAAFIKQLSLGSNLKLIRVFYELSDKRSVPTPNVIVRGGEDGYSTYDEDVVAWVLNNVQGVATDDILEMICTETNDDWLKVKRIVEMIPDISLPLDTMLTAARNVFNSLIAAYLTTLQ